MINTALQQTMFEMYSPELGFDDEYKAHLIRIFEPIIDAVVDQNPDTRSRNHAYNTCDNLFSDLYGYYDSMMVDNSVELYASHVASVFQVLEEARPENLTELKSLVSASVKGIISNNRGDVAIVDEKVAQIYKAVTKRGKGEYNSENLNQYESRKMKELYSYKWGAVIPKVLVDSLVKLEILKSSFGLRSMEHYLEPINVSINKNLFGATVVELFQDNHMYLMPIFTKKNQGKSGEGKSDETETDKAHIQEVTKKLWAYRDEFVKRMRKQYKVPNILFPARQIGAPVNFAGIEGEFNLLLAGLRNELTANPKTSVDIYPVYQTSICMYTLFALYASLEFGRLRDIDDEFFELRNDGRPNIPLLSNRRLVLYLDNSKFFTKLFTENRRFGHIAQKAISQTLG